MANALISSPLLCVFFTENYPLISALLPDEIIIESDTHYTATHAPVMINLMLFPRPPLSSLLFQTLSQRDSALPTGWLK